MFQSVASSVRFPELEAQILQLWKEHGTYEQSLARRQGAPRFVFYEGPPTANGLPHPGHCLTRAIKDLFPRYRTMRGYLCERKAGWDTHGLPVEVEVCKELGIHSKEEIEKFGVEPFIHRCLESVFRYTREWERMTERLGFWVNLDEAYVTYHQSYIESVWWALKNLFDRGLLYQGYKIVWWWAQGGTALSSGEVSQGRREVTDQSVYVRFPLISNAHTTELGLDGAILLVWTTTPWTLPSNQFAATNPQVDYVVVTDEHDGLTERLIIAKSLVETIADKVKRELRIEKNANGEDRVFEGYMLEGLRYLPPFRQCYYDKPAVFEPSLWATPDTTHGTFTAEPGTTFGNLRIPKIQETRDIDGNVERIVPPEPQDWSYAGWRILGANFVTTESGTGLVHQAPAFGEDDFDLWRIESRRLFPGLPFFCAVSPNGQFNRNAPDYCNGRWVKDCDKEIIRDLKQRGLLYHQEPYLHEYPFCWRAEEDPLIQYPRRSWFIRTSWFKARMLANNEQINWLPEHIKHGRFGNFLETNVDWALSRERYWGTPLPIWTCDTCAHPDAVSSYAELTGKSGVQGLERWTEAKKANPTLSEHLKIHKPYIDEVRYACTKCNKGTMRRVPDVIDCWFDSGAMPFAQWGWRLVDNGKPIDPVVNARFAAQFPADFISEALDQTRGWFYSQLAISTLLFGKEVDGDEAAAVSEGLSHSLGVRNLLSTAEQLALLESAIGKCLDYPHPFRNCIVLGLMLGEDGGKMSKSKRNYREPNEIFDRYGADALRWYFFANQPPWTSIRYSEQAIKDSIPEFLLRLWHVYSFFVIYANIDGFDPAKSLTGKVEQLTAQELSTAESFRPAADRGELDQWILSELNRTAAAVVERMDAYDNFAACGHITQFVDALSNWYVRRSRPRFWSEDKNYPAKLDAYWTLYECLLTTGKLIAPFVPFLAEAMWQNLAVAEFSGKTVDSVHLCDYPNPADDDYIKGHPHIVASPDPNATLVDCLLSTRMNLVREIVSFGRSARMGAKLKVRQPLAKVEVILVNREHQPWLQEHSALIAEELNVHEVEFTQQAERYITYTVLPDLKRLGPRLGKRLPEVKEALAKADAGALLAKLEAEGQVALDLPGEPVILDSQDLQIRLQAKPGWAAAQGPDCVVVLSTELNDELIAEGHAREIVHAIQTRRKDLDCQYTDRIEIGIVTDDAALREAIRKFGDYIKSETLAVRLVFEPLPGVEPVEVKIGAAKILLYVKVVKA